MRNTATATGNRSSWLENLDLGKLIPLYRMARFIMVSLLHDGTNLVAKEFVSSQVDRSGVLMLSQLRPAS
jgi:trehalose-6-phosphate synthase